jgi:hypothetical protein
MQTIQRTYEWRSGFGSTALAVLVSFFDTSKDFETNDQRRTFAENMTKDLRFIYAEALGNDPKVIGPSITDTNTNCLTLAEVERLILVSVLDGGVCSTFHCHPWVCSR